MWTHEATELGAVMIRTHKQLALVLVAAWITGGGLGGGGEALEVEFVGVPLAVHFCHDVLVVVVPTHKQNQKPILSKAEKH